MSDMFQEGLLIPPVKASIRGESKRDAAQDSSLPIRVGPDQVEGDLRAQITANKLGTCRIEELLARYGRGMLEAAWERQMDYSEARIRTELGKLPEGNYRITGHLDSDGLDLDKSLKIQITVCLKSGGVTYDFSGSEPQCRGNGQLCDVLCRRHLLLRDPLHQ